LHKKEGSVVVIVDILRATTAMCTAFANGAKAIIPVAKVADAYQYRNEGCLIAGERDGIVIEGADFGNSPFNFTKENVTGKTIAITTTNGTQAIEMSKCCNKVAIGAFSNLNAVGEWLIKQNQNIVILCAGWKNRFNLEDSIFAGALTEYLLNRKDLNSKVDCDSAIAAIDLWNIAKTDLVEYIQKSSHRHRLKRLGLDDVIEYCFTLNTTNVVPVLKGDRLICE